MKSPTQFKSVKLLQLDGSQRFSDSPRTPRTPVSPSIEQFLGGDSSKWSSPHSSPTCRRDYDLEEDHSHHPKKSVLTKVKEKAKKLRQSLSKKKQSDEGNTTPSWCVTLEDEDGEEDAEYLGAPMYESELAPEGYKEHARQHPRAIPVISEKHVFTSSASGGQENEKPGIAQEENEKPNVGQGDEKPPSPHKTLTETVTEKLAPAYATVSDATYAIASKIQSLTVSSPAAVSGTDKKLFVKTGQKNTSPTAQIWDKGVSVKEYVLHKFEPGEDEKALSQVIADVMSPRISPRDGTVVKKVKEAVTNLIWKEEPSQSSAAQPAAISPHIPISSNAYDVAEEETLERILQAN
ncbi:hypothetical protein QYF36_013902 [Acer negundo]|nr:hypothetical protein QYF36_013902 [Acer negundo]